MTSLDQNAYAHIDVTCRKCGDVVRYVRIGPSKPGRRPQHCEKHGKPTQWTQLAVMSPGPS